MTETSTHKPTLSQKGKPLKKINNYRFRFAYKVRNGGEIWRCTDKLCNSRILIHNGMVTNSKLTAHSHKVKKKQKMRKSYQKTSSFFTANGNDFETKASEEEADEFSLKSNNREIDIKRLASRFEKILRRVLVAVKISNFSQSLPNYIDNFQDNLLKIVKDILDAIKILNFTPKSNIYSDQTDSKALIKRLNFLLQNKDSTDSDDDAEIVFIGTKITL